MSGLAIRPGFSAADLANPNANNKIVYACAKVEAGFAQGPELKEHSR